MSKYIITMHVDGWLAGDDREALETDLYDGQLDLGNYRSLQLPSHVEITEDQA